MSRGIYGNFCRAFESALRQGRKRELRVRWRSCWGSDLRAYQYYESGTFYPEIPNLIKLADYFGVTTDYLLGRSDRRG